MTKLIEKKYSIVNYRLNVSYLMRDEFKTYRSELIYFIKSEKMKEITTLKETKKAFSDWVNLSQKHDNDSNKINTLKIFEIVEKLIYLSTTGKRQFLKENNISVYLNVNNDIFYLGKSYIKEIKKFETEYERIYFINKKIDELDKEIYNSLFESEIDIDIALCNFKFHEQNGGVDDWILKEELNLSDLKKHFQLSTFIEDEQKEKSGYYSEYPMEALKFNIMKAIEIDSDKFNKSILRKRFNMFKIVKF